MSQNIRYLRKKKKLSQTELGEVFGLGHSTISGYEKGTSHPPLDMFLKIAEYFEVSLDDLIYRNMSNEGVGELKKKEDLGIESRADLEELIKDIIKGLDPSKF